MIVALALLPLAACDRDDPHAEAKALIAQRCAACHIVPGVREAIGRVGPSLAGIARQQIIAGRFENKPETMVRWLLDPQAMQPGTVMPTTGLSRAQAKAIANYLYTLDKS